MAFALLAPKPSSHAFHERQLSLKEPVKIGRAVAKAKSSSNNGIFDCKVLSRNHAVMWHENGKFMLQDSKSSNGTYVNSVRLSRGSEESEPCEIKSGDTLQFGVEVMENSKNVTHGCIIGMVTLFNEDGTEAERDLEDSPQSLLTLLTSTDQSILPQELWQLAQFLQDALHREQMLENKLATLQRMIGNCHVASEDTFQGFIQEDKLLSRLETLENQLEIVSKETNEEEIQAEMISYQDERLQYESSAKETLQRILKEKIDVLQKCGDLERLLGNSEDQYSYLKSVYDKSQDTIQELIDKNKEGCGDIQRLTEELSDSMKNHENIEEEYAKKVDELKLFLEEAERRGSNASVEVEFLQAECDFAKEQLNAMKERYEQLQERCVAEGTLENGDRSANDLPFASENATLEKDVKNKSEYIQTLKVQLADVMSDLERERSEVELLKSSSSLFDGIDLLNIHEIVNLQDKLTTTKDFITCMGKNIHLDEPITLVSSSYDEFVDLSDFKDMAFTDQIDCYSKALSLCNNFMDSVNGDLQNINMVMSLQEDAPDVYNLCGKKQRVSHQETLLNDPHSNEDVQEMMVVETILKPETSENVNPCTESDLKKNEVLDILLQEDMSDYQLQEYIANEQPHKPTSKICLEVAKQLAKKFNILQEIEVSEDEVDMQVEAQCLKEENDCLKIKITSLLLEYNSLKQRCEKAKEESQQSKIQQSRYKSRETSYVGSSVTTGSPDGTWRVNELHDQLALANQSIDSLRRKRHEEREFQDQKQNQLVNLVLTLFFLMVIFGALVLLGILKITPGSLSLLEETTWTDIWENLF